MAAVTTFINKFNLENEKFNNNTCNKLNIKTEGDKNLHFAGVEVYINKETPRMFYWAIYNKKTREVVEQGEVEVPDFHFSWELERGLMMNPIKYYKIPIARSVDNKKPLIGEGETIEIINKYVFKY